MEKTGLFRRSSTLTHGLCLLAAVTLFTRTVNRPGLNYITGMDSRRRASLNDRDRSNTPQFQTLFFQADLGR
jgi:hypothetical protein